MANHNPPTNGFKKGDPRINRRGRPKSFDALRELAQQIAHEVALDKEGNEVVLGDHLVTYAEAILRRWATSNNPVLQQAFIAYAFGKVPERSELTGKDGGAQQHEVTIHIVDEVTDD